jgi:hypothetical protein
MTAQMLRMSRIGFESFMRVQFRGSLLHRAQPTAGRELLLLRPVLGTTVAPGFRTRRSTTEATMNGLIYLVGLVVIVLFILSALGLR